MEEKLKFNEWMLKIKSIHYADNNAMLKAYEKIEERTEQ